MLSNTPLQGSQFPSYLSRHISVGFDSDDVAALLQSIDSSQRPPPSVSAPHLPAELLLHILEYVPVDYILDWRLVCHGFREAIDGRIMLHHLHRTKLIGYMGSRYSQPLQALGERQYNSIHLIYAPFHHIESPIELEPGAHRSGPVWNAPHAVFMIEEKWFRSFRQAGGAAANGGHTVDDADPRWLHTLNKLQLQRPEEGFGTLRWCIQLDHAVLDADFPLEIGRPNFGMEVDIHEGTIRVAWKNMLLRFLKTETALRRLTQEVGVGHIKFEAAANSYHRSKGPPLHSAMLKTAFAPSVASAYKPD